MADSRSSSKSSFRQVRRISAWIMLVSAVLFATVSILAIWGALGDNAGEAVWRSLASLAVVAFASLIANSAARSADK